MIPKSEEIEKLIFKDRSKTPNTKTSYDDSQVQRLITQEPSFNTNIHEQKPIFITPDHKQLFNSPDEEQLF